MDFTFTEDQDALANLSARIMGDACSDDALRAFAESDAPYDADLWAALAEAGLLGLAISEAGGGLGLGMIEMGLMLAEQGRTLAPVPITAAIVGGAMTLDRHGSAAQRDAWLDRIVMGNALVVPALEENGPFGPPRTAATAQDNGWRLDGVKTAVAYGAQADALLISAMSDDGPALFLVARGAPGLTIEAQQSTDGEPLALLTLAGVTLSGDAVIGSVANGAAIIADTVARLRIALTQRQAGLTAEALRRTAEYTSERKQFGKPIGAMQAVQQRAADAFIDVEAIRSLALLTAWQYDEGTANAADVAAAKHWAAIGGHRVVHAAQHLHGGMGADVTYPIHRYFLTAHAIAASLGGASPSLAEIGTEIAAGRAETLT